jgi:molybdopterin synthase catalytic subunit/molybdopterin converting factor small subunit
MNIRLLAFASAGDALGTNEMEIEMPEGSRVADLRARLDADHPKLQALWSRLAVAVDGRVVTPEEPLTPGAEVALLPPVSGGSGRRANLTDGPIDTDAVVATVAGPGRGAVLIFLGTVRDSHGGRGVEKLIYSAYRTMALEGLERIVADLEASSPGLRAAIVHRLGEVPVGEASVVIAVASPHRAAAYEANRTALERLKTEIPIWKREHYTEGPAVWREEEPLVPSTSAARTD